MPNDQNIKLVVECIHFQGKQLCSIGSTFFSFKKKYFRNVLMLWNADRIRASRWRASHIPAPAPARISEHIEIPNAFLQSSSIGLLPVTVSRFQLKKLKRSCVTIKNKDPKSYFLTSSDPMTCPRDKSFCTTVFYSLLPSIWYAT